MTLTNEKTCNKKTVGNLIFRFKCLYVRCHCVFIFSQVSKSTPLE